jgi:glycosyltransferase involved in cell wall biosynthesis
MQKENLISIVMPCYNSSATLARSIESALSQSHEEIELIVVDDGSTDSSVAIAEEICQRDRRLQLIRTNGNRGAAQARNRAIAVSRGEFIAFLDADDTWDPRCMERLLLALTARPDAALAYCGWQNIGVEGGRAAPYIPPDYELPDSSGREKLNALIENCPFPIHATLTRTQSVVEVGGFDETLSSCMDFDLWLRICWSQSIVRVPEVLAYYWHHDVSTRITSNRAKIALNHWRVQRKFLNEHRDVSEKLGPQRVHDVTHRRLFSKGLDAHWKGDFDASRSIFRNLIPYLYLEPGAWKYLALGSMPRGVYRIVMSLVSLR